MVKMDIQNLPAMKTDRLSGVCEVVPSQTRTLMQPHPAQQRRHRLIFPLLLLILPAAAQAQFNVHQPCGLGIPRSSHAALRIHGCQRSGNANTQLPPALAVGERKAESSSLKTENRLYEY
jgi:hypothetical protein